MATPQQLDLVFDLDVKKAEKKVANPTKNLVMSILQEAGFDGAWEVRDSRQIKKRGRERFGVIRLESRVGRVGIRMWCKPRGNETCFEYSLIPPSEIDVQEAFSVLKRVNGVTLRIPESGLIPLAIKGRMLDVPPVPVRLERVVEVEGNEAVEKQEPEIKEEPPLPIAIDKEVHEFPSLQVHMGESGGSAIDKALVALGFVTAGGYAKKAEAFESMVKNLGLKEISIQKGVSLDETLRVITSSMKDDCGYIRRVRHSPKDRRTAADSIMGFKLTGKGQDRMDAVKSKYGPEVEGRLGDGWRLPESQSLHDAPSVDEGVARSQASPALLPDAIARIKGLLDSYEEAVKQVHEHDQVIVAIDQGIRGLREQISDLEVSEESVSSKIAELQAELGKISSRKSELSQGLDKKNKERKEWEGLREPYSKEKSRVESLLSGLGVLK